MQAPEPKNRDGRELKVVKMRRMSRNITVLCRSLKPPPISLYVGRKMVNKWHQFTSISCPISAIFFKRTHFTQYWHMPRFEPVALWKSTNNNIPFNMVRYKDWTGLEWVKNKPMSKAKLWKTFRKSGGLLDGSLEVKPKRVRGGSRLMHSTVCLAAMQAFCRWAVQ